MIKAKSGTGELGTAPVSKLIRSFSSMTLASLLLASVYTLTDILFVSWSVGSDAMGGISVVYPFILLQSAISTALGGGAASIVSRKLGEKKHAEAGEITLNAMAAFYGFSLLIALLGLCFRDPLLQLFGVTKELYPYAKPYFTILLLFNVFSTGFSSIIRAEGRIAYSLFLWVFPTSLNIALDALFVLVFHWGVAGSALATGLCQVASTITGLFFFIKLSSQTFRGARVHFKKIGEILLMGLPSLVQMGSVSIITLLLNNALGFAGGTEAVNTFAYLSKILLFFVLPITAVTQALSPIVGFNHGAKSPDRVHETIRRCTLLCFLYVLFAAAILESFPLLFFRIFTKDAAIFALGKIGLRITALSLLFTPLPLLFGAAFQAVGDKTRALILYSADLIFMIPAILIASFFKSMIAVWWAYTAAAVAATVLTAFFLKKHRELS